MSLPARGGTAAEIAKIAPLRRDFILSWTLFKATIFLPFSVSFPRRQFGGGVFLLPLCPADERSLSLGRPLKQTVGGGKRREEGKYTHSTVLLCTTRRGGERG